MSVNTQLEQVMQAIGTETVRVNNVYTHTGKTQKHSSLQYSNIKTRHAKKMITNKRTSNQ